MRRRRASIKLGVVQRYQAPVHHFNPAIEDDLPKPTEYCPLTRELLAMLLEPDVPAPAYDLALVKRTLLSVGVAALRNDLPGAGLVHDFLGDVLSPAQLSQVLADIRSGELTARQLTSA